MTLMGAVLIEMLLVVLAGAVLLGAGIALCRAVAWVARWPQRRRQHRAALLADLEWQDQAYLAGDERGVYGRFIPLGPPR